MIEQLAGDNQAVAARLAEEYGLRYLLAIEGSLVTATLSRLPGDSLA